MTSNKALEIVYSVCQYFDCRPWHDSSAQSAAKMVQEIIDRKCKHYVAAERVGNGPWKYSFNREEGFKCGECGIALKVKEWEEVK